MIETPENNALDAKVETPEKKWCVDGEKYDCDDSEYHIKIREQMEFLTPKIKRKKLFRATEIKA